MIHRHLTLLSVAVRTTPAVPVEDVSPVLGPEAGALAGSTTFVVLRHRTHLPLVRASAFGRACLSIRVDAIFDPAVTQYAFRSHAFRIAKSR